MATIMNKSNHQRKLLIVPILHTREDMGSLGSRLPAADGYASIVSKFWEEVKEKVKSPNYELLRFLKQKGAQVFGTEDPKLLKKEYQFVSQANKDREKATSLLAKRDSYITKRIDKTLNQGDLGILFIGAAHKIQNKLPKDIQAEILWW